MSSLMLGKNLDRDLSNVEVTGTNDNKMSFRFRVKSSTTEKYVRERVFGEGVDFGYAIYVTDNEDDPDKATTKAYYGYTRVDSVVFEEVDDDRFCVATLRKPTLDEFIGDVYKELDELRGTQTNLTMNVGGTFVDIQQDNMQMMLSQLGGY